MATPQKSISAAETKKKVVFQKAKSKKTRKKFTEKSSSKMTKAAQLAADFDTPIYAAPVDKAHSSGHRKMNLKDLNDEANASKVKNLKSAENRKTESDLISELQSPQRRSQGKINLAPQGFRHGSKKNSH